MNISVHLQLAVNNNCDEGLSLNCGSLRNIYCVLSLYRPESVKLLFVTFQINK